jgi:NAD+ synthase
MPSHTILYIVDPQVDFMNPSGALYVPGAKEIIPKMVEAIRGAKKNNLDIYVSADCHWEDTTPEFSKNGGDFPVHCVAGTVGAEIVPEIQAELDDYEHVHMLYKNGVDIWKEPETENIFYNIQKEILWPHVLIMGVATDFCVKKAVKGFERHGWDITILSNCVAGVDSIASKHFLKKKSRITSRYNRRNLLEILNEDFNHIRDRLNVLGYFTENDSEKITPIIEEFIIQQVINHKKDGVVIGLSGGMDSTLVAAATKSAFMHWPPSRVPEYRIVGLSIPTAVNSEQDTSDAAKIAEALGIEFHTVDLEKITCATIQALPEQVSPYDKGNMISRLRANVLHTYAAQHNLLVLGTGNRDEDYGVGYYTLFGDGAVHCSPIGEISKRMVKILLKTYGKRFSRIIDEIANKEPAAGLESGQTDFKDLGYSYEFVELCYMIVLVKELGVKPNGIILRLFDQFDKDHERAKELGCVKFTDWSQATDDYGKRHEIAISKEGLVNPPKCYLHIFPYVESPVSFKEGLK